MIEHRQILDHLILASDTAFYQFVALAFGLTGSFLSSQIIINVMMRTGHVAEAAHRQYGYIAFSVLAAIVALIIRSPEVYLALASVAEIASAVLFIAFSPHQRIASTKTAGRRSLPAAVVSSISVLLVWAALRAPASPMMEALSGFGIVEGALFVLAEAALLAAVQLIINFDLYRGMLVFASRKVRP
jgi:hypothetical protein